DLAHAELLVGSGNGEDAMLMLDILNRGFHEMGGDFLRFLNDLVDRLDNRRAADGKRARAVGTHAEGDFTGVPMHDLDTFDRHAKLVGDDLRKGRLMPLAVAVTAGKDRYAAGRVKAHFRRFPETDTGPERADRRRRRNAAGLDIGRNADPAPFAVCFRLRLAGREA